MTMKHLLTPNLSHLSVPISLTSPHIFVVEKNPGIAEVITTMLTLAGYHPTKSRDERTALSPIFTTHPPALILLDISLPRESWSNILTNAQKQYAAIDITPPSIIVLTTSPSIRTEVEGIGYRALLKPFHMHDLLQTVYEVLHGPLVQTDSLEYSKGTENALCASTKGG